MEIAKIVGRPPDRTVKSFNEQNIKAAVIIPHNAECRPPEYLINPVI